MTQNAFVAWEIWPDGTLPSRIELQQVRPDGPDPAALGIVVIYVDPKHALARAVVSSADPGKALSDWTDTARLVLGLHRQNRSRIRLVQRPLTALEETARKQKLLDLFDGTALPSLSPEPWTEDESALAWAALALLSSDDRRLLHDELIAATTGGGSDPPDAEAALARLCAQLDAVRQRELLLAQVDDLERQLRKVIDVRERLWGEIKDLKSRLWAETDARKAVYASTSWRVTRPLRGLSRLLKGRRRKAFVR